MQQKNENHSFTGIQRDLSISKHPAEFLYDAKNIRLTSREGDTMFAITNEKGTEDIGITLKGLYLGHCTLNKYLIVFTKFVDSEEQHKNNIFRVDLKTDLETEKIKTLYSGDLNIKYPVEAIPSYESEDVQKVYWTDGSNQPRVIDILKVNGENGVTYSESSFDFVPELQLNEIVKVSKLHGDGMFPSGVIQYAFTYYNKFRQESNIFHTTPLYYISHIDRGASPEESVAVSFKIDIAKLDTNFEYLRIYSILRTSLNSTPVVKRVRDINIKETYYLGEEAEKLDSKEDSKINSIQYSNNVGVDFENIEDVSEDNNFTRYDSLEDVMGSLNNSRLLIGKIREFTSNITEDVTYYKIVTTENTVVKIDNYYYFPKDSGDIFYLCITKNKFLILGAYWQTDVQLSPKQFIRRKTLYSSSELTGVSFIDNGTVGENIDPTELLFKNKSYIVAKTLTQKDNTLFLGNITENKSTLLWDDIDYLGHLKKLIEKPNWVNSTLKERKYYSVGSSDTIKYFNTMNPISEAFEDYCGTSCFKSNEYYRLGIQFQHKTGRWEDPIWIGDIQHVKGKPIVDENFIKVPEFTYTAPLSAIENIKYYCSKLNYKKARPVFAIPGALDRTIIAQGLACPTVYRKQDRFLNGSYNAENDFEGDGKGTLHAQSSWIFRPYYDSSALIQRKASNGGGFAPYTDRPLYTWNPKLYDSGEGLWTEGGTAITDLPYVNSTEVMGNYKNGEEFYVDPAFITFHSPEIEVSDYLYNTDLSSCRVEKIGNVELQNTYSNISIQLENPPISGEGTSSVNKQLITEGGAALLSGWFFLDKIVTTRGDAYIPYPDSRVPAHWWPICMWHRKRSLNNDVDRTGRSALLSNKVISNYRNSNGINYLNSSMRLLSNDIKLHSSNDLSVVKVDNNIYMGNIDTMLTASLPENMISASTKDSDLNLGEIFAYLLYQNIGRLSQYVLDGDKVKFRKFDPTIEYFNNIPNALSGIESKEPIRMRYKASPHWIISLDPQSNIYQDSTDQSIPLLEITKPYNESTFFGGTSKDALESNVWIPCGPAVKIEGNSEFTLNYKWGDTYFQKFECLKTYPYSNDDVNQNIEIAGFWCETRVNVDGRYDKNRGSTNNLHVSSTNFNLINPVYSQMDNFFSYRITDLEQQSTKYSNLITWSKEKIPGADVDNFTDITLASTYNMDGSKGEVKALKTWKDSIYCFQDYCVSNVLFNSRVQIPTSDGVPIEITNSYKVDGYRIISDNVGCENASLIKDTPSGIYFMDNISNKLMHLGGELADITTTHKMSSWFRDEGNTVKKLLYDNINSDLYLIQGDKALCFSETLGQFTSFMSYGGMLLLESYNDSIFSLKDEYNGEYHSGKLYKMFTGDYNYFFNKYEPWEFTFISNGLSNGDIDYDKIFSNIDYRMDIDVNDILQHDSSLDFIRVTNEYQDTGVIDLHKVVSTVPYLSRSNSNLLKKFRVWRLQIPRNKNSRDRIRNTWCKITLGCDTTLENTKAVLHDINVKYYV